MDSFEEGHIVTNPISLDCLSDESYTEIDEGPTNHPITMQNQLANALSGTTSPENIFHESALWRRLSKISATLLLYTQRVQFEENTEENWNDYFNFHSRNRRSDLFRNSGNDGKKIVWK